MQAEKQIGKNYQAYGISVTHFYIEISYQKHLHEYTTIEHIWMSNPIITTFLKYLYFLDFPLTHPLFKIKNLGNLL